ncbi:unnamed protein product, partial [Closterium sp. NIES-54]
LCPGQAVPHSPSRPPATTDAAAARELLLLVEVLLGLLEEPPVVPKYNSGTVIALPFNLQACSASGILWGGA